MTMSPISASPISAGLAGTVAAIQRGQSRFDARAQQVNADALALTDDTGADPSGGDTPSLTTDIVGMQADAIANQILYNVFKRQSEQQGELADLIKPDPTRA